MADKKEDFFQEGEEGGDEQETIKVGEKEYSQEDLNKLVGLGEKAAEIEKHHGAIDKFVAESGRRADEIGKYKKQIQEFEEKVKEAQTKDKQVSAEDLSPEQVDLAKKQLYNLLGGEPITQDNFARLYVSMREGEKLIDECDNLSKEINGEDGRPKFERDDIIRYMSEVGIKKPLLAYKDKFEKELKEWETAQLANKKKNQAETLKPGGDKQPSEVRPTKENLGSMINEALYGPQE